MSIAIRFDSRSIAPSATFGHPIVPIVGPTHTELATGLRADIEEVDRLLAGRERTPHERAFNLGWMDRLNDRECCPPKFAGPFAGELEGRYVVAWYEADDVVAARLTTLREQAEADEMVQGGHYAW